MILVVNTMQYQILPSPSQALGLTLVGLGVWLELGEQSIQAVINQQQLLYGPYLIIAAGCAVVLIALIGMVGACCDHKINRFLLIFVSTLVIILVTWALCLQSTRCSLNVRVGGCCADWEGGWLLC